MTAPMCQNVCASNTTEHHLHFESKEAEEGEEGEGGGGGGKTYMGGCA